MSASLCRRNARFQGEAIIFWACKLPCGRSCLYRLTPYEKTFFKKADIRLQPAYVHTDHEGEFRIAVDGNARRAQCTVARLRSISLLHVVSATHRFLFTREDFVLCLRKARTMNIDMCGQDVLDIRDLRLIVNSVARRSSNSGTPYTHLCEWGSRSPVLFEWPSITGTGYTNMS